MKKSSITYKTVLFKKNETNLSITYIDAFICPILGQHSGQDKVEDGGKVHHPGMGVPGEIHFFAFNFNIDH